MTDQRPGFVGRVLARLQGEIPATELEAYRRAGSDVYALIDDIEHDRAEGRLQGRDAWSEPDALQAASLCAWNAFALQVLGDQLLAADYESEPSTVGYLPPVTAQQVLAFYGQVPDWLRRARQARASESYRLDVDVPAALPSWSEVEPCPRPHLAAMRTALDRLRTHTSAAMSGFHIDLDDDERRRAHDRVHEVLAEAEAAASYADRLWAPAIPMSVHEAIEGHAQLAVERFYEAGQLLYMPRLALAPRRQMTQPRPRSLPGPGAPGFDPWRLTDPDSRERWKVDRKAREAIEVLWANDPDAERTLAIQAEIEAAAERGDIERLSSVGPYYCCPWAPIWVVKRPLVIGGRRLGTLEQFTYDVSAEEIAEGGEFVRRILVGEFRPTDEIDYCIPGRGHDD